MVRSSRRVRNRWTLLAAFAALAAVVLDFAAGPTDGAQKPQLFTNQDAQRLRLSDAECKRPPRTRSVGETNGPRIVVKAPAVRDDDASETITTETPTRLHVSFENNLAPVDTASLDVSARKGIFSKSLTDVLRPYVGGSTIAVDQLEIPEGRFLVLIQIADTARRKTARSFRLDVRAAP